MDLLMGVVGSLIASVIIAAVSALFGRRLNTPAWKEQTEVVRKTTRTAWGIPGFFKRESETEITRIHQTH